MDEELNLHKMIIQSVETQIRENNPPATKQTYERLLANGHDEATVKEMIASVIAEEIYYMMRDERKINEEFFAERLSKLE